MSISFPVSRGILNGIFSICYDDKCGSLINVTSSGKFYGKDDPSNLLIGNSFYTESSDTYNQWILFKIRGYMLDITGYSLYCDVINEQATNWQIDVATSRSSWQILDVQNSQTTYKTSKVYSTKTLKRIKYIKFINKGYGGIQSDHNNYVYIKKIDFYGSLTPISYTIFSKCKTRFGLSLHVLIFLAK